MDEERPELDFHFYFGVLRRRAWIIVVVVILTTGAALARSLSTTKIYETASTVLLTDPAQSTVGRGGNLEIATEIALIQSGPIQRAVAKSLGADAAKITSLAISPVGDTTLIAISAQSSSPRAAQRAANTYARKYVQLRTDELVESANKQIDAFTKRTNDLNAQLDAAQLALFAAGGSDSDLEARIASLNSSLQNYNQQISDLQLQTELRSTEGARIVDLAGLPTSPISPDTKRDVMLGFALGIVLGLALAFLYEFLDDKIKTQEDVARYAHGLTVIAEIPTMAKERNGRRLVALDDPSSGAAEAYRSLRTSLRLLSLRKPIQTLLVTSSMAGEGKTTTAANLGVTLARSGLRVTIVDLDLRRASLAPLFGGDNDIGLMSVLVGENTLAEAMYEVPIAAGVPPLRFLPAGPLPPNPSEIMGTTRMAEVINNLRASADFVIIDSPPIVPVTDAVVLSNRVDGVLMVIQSGKTRRRHLNKSSDLLDQADAPMVGAVMNGAGRHARYGYYERYGYGYKRSSKPRKGKKYKGARPDTDRRPRMPAAEVTAAESRVIANGNGNGSANGTANGTSAEPTPSPGADSP